MKNKFAILLIDLQQGFHDLSYWGIRNNPDLEKNISLLLSIGRERKLDIVHIQHLSKEPKSPLRPSQAGVDFISGCHPLLGERIFQKNVNSAFIGTQLNKYLKEQLIDNLIIAGLTTDHCVSTTARMSANLGFNTYILDDCTATFERKWNESIFSADLVHQLSLASLSNEFARIIQIKDMLSICP